MKKIRTSKKGFTLAELLIVVAIIGVLVGISIPIFTTQLEKSRESTDIANMRAAKAAAVSAYLGEEKIGSTQLGSAQTGAETLYYDAENGKLLDSNTGITAYGKGTTTTGAAANTFMGYDPAKAAADYITVTVAADGSVTMSFNKASA